jgi:hypothetical protein
VSSRRINHGSCFFFSFSVCFLVVLPSRRIRPVQMHRRHADRSPRPSSGLGKGQGPPSTFLSENDERHVRRADGDGCSRLQSTRASKLLVPRGKLVLFSVVLVN